ncbi:MAG: hypothetical protein JJU45_03905 [Acidimicrobiia bacterium]|nr:hypothetical protein [Acidimicrobiia bacterium]
MASEPHCPRCDAVVEPHWDWCHACGFGDDPAGDADPTGPDAATNRAGPTQLAMSQPAPRRVYEPDDEPGRWRVVSIALMIVAGFALAMLAAQVFLFDRGDTSTSVLSVADLGGQGEQTPIDDGWRVLESAGHPLRLEVPQNLWRTHDAARLGPGESARATIWVDIDEESGRYVFVAAIPVAGTSLDPGEGELDPIRATSLDLAPLHRSTLGEAVPVTLAPGAGWRRSGLTAAGDPLEVATTMVERTLVIVAVADPDGAHATAELDRMATTIESR